MISLPWGKGAHILNLIVDLLNNAGYNSEIAQVAMIFKCASTKNNTGMSHIIHLQTSQSICDTTRVQVSAQVCKPTCIAKRHCHTGENLCLSLDAYYMHPTGCVLHASYLIDLILYQHFCQVPIIYGIKH